MATATKAKNTELGEKSSLKAQTVAMFVKEIESRLRAGVIEVSVTLTTSLEQNFPTALSFALPATNLSAFFQAVADELSSVESTGDDSSSSSDSELRVRRQTTGPFLRNRERLASTKGLGLLEEAATSAALDGETQSYETQKGIEGLE